MKAAAAFSFMLSLPLPLELLSCMLCVFSEWICMKGRNALPWYSWLGIIMTVAAATSLAGVFTHTLSCTDTVIVANCHTLYCQSYLNGTIVQDSLYHFDAIDQPLFCKVFVADVQVDTLKLYTTMNVLCTSIHNQSR